MLARPENEALHATAVRAAHFARSLALALIVVASMTPLALLLRRKAPEIAHQVAGGAAAAKRLSAGLSPRALQALLALAGLSCCAIAAEACPSMDCPLD